MSQEPLECLRTSLRFIAEWEQRVSRQKQIIDELKMKRYPTVEAEATLRQQEKVLAMLRNHTAVMQAVIGQTALRVIHGPARTGESTVLS